jgi:hypothetical protein
MWDGEKRGNFTAKLEELDSRVKMSGNIGRIVDFFGGGVYKTIL